MTRIALDYTERDERGEHLHNRRQDQPLSWWLPQLRVPDQELSSDILQQELSGRHFPALRLLR